MGGHVSQRRPNYGDQKTYAGGLPHAHHVGHLPLARNPHVGLVHSVRVVSLLDLGASSTMLVKLGVALGTHPEENDVCRSVLVAAERLEVLDLGSFSLGAMQASMLRKCESCFGGGVKSMAPAPLKGM